MPVRTQQKRALPFFIISSVLVCLFLVQQHYTNIQFVIFIFFNRQFLFTIFLASVPHHQAGTGAIVRIGFSGEKARTISLDQGCRINLAFEIMSQNWEADKMLDVYIHDYLLKRNLQASAKAFQTEGKVSTEPVAIDAPGGFLYEWWSVFWDIFISRTNEKHSEVAASYIDTQLQKTREQHNQQQQHPPHQQQMQIQQMQQLLQRQHAQQQQQQRRDGSHHLCSTSTAVAGTDSFIRQNQGTVNAMATKIYEERLKLPHPRDVMDDTTLKRFGDNSVQHMDTNPTTLLKTVSPHGQPSGQVLLGSAGTNSTSMHQAFHHQLHGAALDSKNDMGMILNQRSSTVDPAMLGVSSSGLTKSSLLASVTGVNQGQNTLPPLKGWPLTGIEQLRPGILQTQKSFMASPQALHQFQLLSPQQQQIVLQAQAQGNLAASGPLLPELESRRMQMMLNSRNVVANKDGQTGSASEISHSAGSPMQVQSPLSRGPGSDHEIFLKMKMAQIQQQRLHQLQQHHQQHIVQQSQSTERSEVANPHQDKVGTALTVDSSLSNSFRGNDQAYNTVEPSPSTNSTGTGKDASKGQKGRKRKQPGSSVGPAISNGTVNNAGPSPSSAPSTPSTQTPGDVLSIGSALHPSGSSSKPLTMYRQDGTRASPSNHLVDIDRFGEDGSLDDNVESFFHDDTELREMSGRGMDDRKGFSFHEIGVLRAHQNKVGCCHFSSDGKLLASAGHDKKAVLWNMDTFQHKSILEEHTHFITDVRFSTGSYTTARLATSSFDRTVRVWETENASYSLRTFTGHTESVTSVDFHPKKDDLLCSCDSNNEIRLWNVTQGKGIKTFKGGMKQVRFQARTGRLLAAATENNVSIFDYEADSCLQTLKGHVKPVHSICWDPTGDYLASVSEDSARIWCLRSGKDAECVHDLNCSGRMSHSCVFHPTYQTILIIGCYQSLELWDMTENKTMSIPAHHGLIASLAVSAGSGMIASASHDATVKLWK